MQCRDPFGMPAGLCQIGIDRQAIAIFHQPIPHEAQLGLLAFSLPIELRIRIGRRSMRVVGASLAMEVCFVIPSARIRRWFAMIDAQASISVPSTEKWSVDSSRFTWVASGSHRGTYCWLMACRPFSDVWTTRH